MRKTDSQIKDFILKNKICVVTNSNCLPGTTFLASMKSYLNFVPIHNFWVIPGSFGENFEKPFYGWSVFYKVINELTANDHFDYVIYIDDDCFIHSGDALIHEFEKFMKSKCCMAGPPDGGAICHRNHAQILFNTFISFWNIKLIRENRVKFFNMYKTIIDKAQTLSPNNQFMKVFCDMVDKKLLNELIHNSADVCNRIMQYRLANFNQGETPYCERVRNDETNPIEPHQVPYSTDADMVYNFEPYYIIQEAVVLATQTPIYYLFATDKYLKNLEDENSTDNSGLTSVVMTSDTNEDICYHTWFSRAYSKWPKNQLSMEHTKRINKIIKSL